MSRTVFLRSWCCSLRNSLRCIQLGNCIPEKGLFGEELLKHPSGFKLLNEKVRKRSFELVDKIVNRKCEKKVVEVFDDLSNEICSAADLAECVRNMHSAKEFSAAAQESMKDFTELVESLNTRSDLYKALKDSLEAESSSLTDVDKRTALLFLDDFEQAGVSLTKTQKCEYVRLSKEIFMVGSQFAHGAELPVTVAPFYSKMYRVKRHLYSPNTLAVNRSTRQWCYATYYSYNEEQEKRLRHLITCRHLLARLTGYQSYAHRAQHNSLLGSYENAHDFLIEVIKSCQSAAEQELAVLADVLAQVESKREHLCESDLTYLCMLYRENAFGQLQHLSRYFSFNNLLRGFELITERLYNVSFSVMTPVAGEIWPGNVIKIDVFQDKSKFLGTIYIDIQDRQTKTSGDCHFTVRCSKQLDDGSYQTPIVVLSLSLTKGLENIDNVFLVPHQAENFFHEMGHAMHSMLARTQYQHVAGTRCSTDMAEIPSNLMEYFFNNIDILREIAKDNHGRPISVEDAASLITSRFAFTSLEMLQQAVYSLFDLEAHGGNAEGIMNGRVSTADLYASIWSVVFPNVKKETGSAWHHRFAHLVPYGAKYYSYLVARATASLIWNTRFRDCPFSRENGLAWAKVLSKGGSLPSAELLNSALGYWPTVQNLAMALKEEADQTCQRSAVSI
ncbi:peptidase family M3 containing protein [Loa loa]|nr:peptidase family M3 containing protein [Loa loa]EFO25864.1 peptidase family M3 containing protein [Loa loa]